MPNRKAKAGANPLAGRRLGGVVWFLFTCGLVIGVVAPHYLRAESIEPPATLVILNARIQAGTRYKAGNPGHDQEPTALAVVGETIVAVGETEVVRVRVGPDTRVIDARGRRVIPGITDSHTHIISGGFQLGRLALRDAADREEFIRAVASDARAKKAGQWVLGGRWSVESWADPTPPNRGWLDPVTGDTPVYLIRMDGHQALVNSAALTLAGIDALGPDDPKGGEIERDPETGEPTGVLKESAKDLVSRLIPSPSAQERYEALKRAMRHANTLGITSVHDMSVLADLETFRQAQADDSLTLRITTYLSVDDWAAHRDDLKRRAVISNMFRVAGFKGYMDGSLGSRTAYMREPYSDAAPNTRYPRGQLTAMADPPESFRDMVALADARGVQLAVHAIGDEANHLLLNAYEAAVRRNGRRDARHRIEHAQHLRVEDIPRLARLGVVASMQPFHKADDGRYAEAAIGTERLEGSYAYRRLLDAGTLLCFGSDWPNLVMLNPFAGIDAAVNAKTLAGNVWLRSHSLTVAEALYAYTVAPARAVHRENHLGTIEVGKLADIVVLSEDPLAMPAHRLAHIKATHTIVGGRLVYRRAE